MAFTVEYKDPLIWISLAGSLSGRDLTDAAEIVAAEEARHAVVPHRITDLTGATEMKIGFDEIFSLAELRRAMRFPNFFKSAIVACNESQTGFARMFQTLNNNPQITVRIFPDLQGALDWVLS